MGLLEKIFKPRYTGSATSVDPYFKLLSGYTPVFTSRGGGMYEMELTNAAIHAIATACSKLKPEVVGTAKPHLRPLLELQPNQFMDTSKFLYRLATILHMDTVAFVVPSFDLYNGKEERVTSLWSVLPNSADIRDVNGVPWLHYQFGLGQQSSLELDRVGILTTRQYRSDIWGDGNGAVDSTLDLLTLQQQGQSNAIETSAVIRFLAKLAGSIRPEDREKERAQFAKENLSAENTSGVMLIDSKYEEVKQLDYKPYVIDAEQMRLIKDNVYSYFGVNEAILQNSYDEDTWNAFYEGKVEPFALQLGLVLTSLLFTPNERAHGNRIVLSANRLQYANNTSKLNVTTQLVDRGLLTMNQALEIWNLPGIGPEGDRRIIRGEYIDVANLPDHTIDQAKSYLKPGDTPANIEPTEPKE